MPLKNILLAMATVATVALAAPVSTTPMNIVDHLLLTPAPKQPERPILPRDESIAPRGKKDRVKDEGKDKLNNLTEEGLHVMGCLTKAVLRRLTRHDVVDLDIDKKIEKDEECRILMESPRMDTRPVALWLNLAGLDVFIPNMPGDKYLVAYPGGGHDTIRSRAAEPPAYPEGTAENSHDLTDLIMGPGPAVHNGAVVEATKTEGEGVGVFDLTMGHGPVVLNGTVFNDTKTLGHYEKPFDFTKGTGPVM